MEENPERIELKDVHPQILRAYRLRSAGKLDEAIALGMQSLQELPQHSEVNFLLGVLHVDKMQYPLAERFLTLAIGMNPNRLEYYLVFGQLMKAQKRYLAARNAFLQCLKIDPKHFMAHFNLGRLYQLQHDDQHAMDYFKHAKKINPDYPPLYYFMGMIEHESKAYDQALSNVQHAIELDPKFHYAWLRLGRIYLDLEFYPDAIEAFNKVLSIIGQDPQTLSFIGQTLIKLMRFDDAIKVLRQSLDLSPMQASTWRLLTRVYRYNDLEHADRLIMETNLSNSNLPEEDHIHYHYALGHFFNDCQDFASAFSHYTKANELQRQHLHFNAKEFDEKIANIITGFNKTKLTRGLSKIPNKKITPVFLFGFPSKNIEYLKDMLSDGVNVFKTADFDLESVLKQHIDDEITMSSPKDLIKALSPNILKTIRNQYYKLLTKHVPAGAKFVVNACEYNTYYIGLLHILYPQAKFIFLEQDKMEACLNYHCDFDLNHIFDLHLTAFYYQQLIRLAKHWGQVLPKHVIAIHEDKLTDDPKALMEHICTHLQLDEHHHDHDVQLSAYRRKRAEDYSEQLVELHQALKRPISVKNIQSAVTFANDETLLSKAFKAFHDDNLFLAKQICDDIKQQYPDNPDGWHLSGLIHRTLEEPSLAESDFKQAIELDKQAIHYYRDLNILYLENDQVDQAENVFKQIERLLKDQAKLMKGLTSEESSQLQNALTQKCTVLKKHGKSILLKGKIHENKKTSSFMTRTWERYFHDISHGSFRNINQPGSGPWRMRSWHYLFKNLSLIEEIFSHKKEQITICDIGCSSGYLRRFLEGNFSPFENKSLFYWGVDIREDQLRDAVMGVHNVESGADGVNIPSAYLYHDIQYGLPFQDNHFDFLINFELIKYLPIEQAEFIFSEIHRILKSDGVLYLSTTYSANHPGFLESVPYEQIEVMLEKAGFSIQNRYGSQNHLRRLVKHIKEEHVPLVKELMHYHPPEMVVAMIAPLYPQLGEQVTFKCIKR